MIPRDLCRAQWVDDRSMGNFHAHPDRRNPPRKNILLELMLAFLGNLLRKGGLCIALD